MILFLIISFLAMLLIDLPRVIKAKQIRLFIVYGGIYATAFTICLLLTLGISVVSPLTLLSDLFKNVLKISY